MPKLKNYIFFKEMHHNLSSHWLIPSRLTPKNSIFLKSLFTKLLQNDFVGKFLSS